MFLDQRIRHATLPRDRDTAEEIRCISHTDPAFRDVLRLRRAAQPPAARGGDPQDAYDQIANIYVAYAAGEAVLTLRTIHARAVAQCEMEGLYPAAIVRDHRDVIMHTSRLVRHPGRPANRRRLMRFMSHVLEHEFAQGIRITFATSPLKYLAGYRALGFAVVKHSSFCLLENGDEGRLIVQPASARWRSPFAARWDASGADAAADRIHADVLAQVEGGIWRRGRAA
jgi:hypothetical protein